MTSNAAERGRGTGHTNGHCTAAVSNAEASISDVAVGSKPIHAVKSRPLAPTGHLARAPSLNRATPDFSGSRAGTNFNHLVRDARLLDELDLFKF